MSDIPGYLTVPEAAKRRGVDPDSILALIHRDRLKGYRVGKQWLIREEDLENFQPLKPGRRKKALVIKKHKWTR
jgi:excisionase family DNA binding protein